MNTVRTNNVGTPTYPEIARLAARGPLSAETRRGQQACLVALAIFLVGYFCSNSFDGSGSPPELIVGINAVIVLTLIFGTYFYVRFASVAIVEFRLFRIELEAKYDEVSESLHAMRFDSTRNLANKLRPVGGQLAATAAVGSIDEGSRTGALAADGDGVWQKALDDLAWLETQRAFSTLRLARNLGRLRGWLDVVFPSVMMMAALACTLWWALGSSMAAAD